MKRVAIMQPYLFPYLGYFQLMNAVDLFVGFDDVQFIRRGWINRNAISLGGRAHRFTLPVLNNGQTQRIDESRVPDHRAWKKKFLRTLGHAYKNAPYKDPVLEIVDQTFSGQAGFLMDALKRSLELVRLYLAIRTPMVFSSQHYKNRHKRGSDRVVDICRLEDASDYFNLPGGRCFYDKGIFQKSGIKLSFLEYRPMPYRQEAGQFIPSLSILDVVAFNAPHKIREMLSEDYQLI